jgi:hypothetical protein
MRQSGLADLLPSLRPETVYVGTSGGAMVATPDFGGATYDESEPLTGSDRSAGLVDFSVFPHLIARMAFRDPSGRDRSMGRRAVGAGVRDRRSDRHQSGRRHRRVVSRGTGNGHPSRALASSGMTPRMRVPFTLSNIKEDLEDIGSRFDGAPDLEFRAATKALELENPP